MQSQDNTISRLRDTALTSLFFWNSLAGWCLWLLLSVTGCYNQGGFDQDVWMANAANTRTDNPRSGMVEELLDEILTPGMSKKEIIDLLGPPDSQWDGLDLYDIGASPYGIDYEYLTIEYDELVMKNAYISRS